MFSRLSVGTIATPNEFVHCLKKYILSRLQSSRSLSRASQELAVKYFFIKK